MRSESLFVRHVAGRYPESGVLRSENIVAHIRQHGPIVEIRLDDEEHPDAWLEITLELNRGERHRRDAGE